MRQPQSLFEMIRHTHAVSPQGTIVAYADNAAVIEGATVERFYSGADGRYAAQLEPTCTLMKVETHNHPTAIAPFPGAATGSGGEIRDEGATGIGAKPKAGRPASPFRICASRARTAREHELVPDRTPRRSRSCSRVPSEASFNNEFGRPNLLGTSAPSSRESRARCAAIKQS